MTGQYSLAKAKKIKEDRELAAEVEAVQKGAAVWGESDDDGATRTRTSRSGAAGGNGGGGTGRRLVRIYFYRGKESRGYGLTESRYRNPKASKGSTFWMIRVMIQTRALKVNSFKSRLS